MCQVHKHNSIHIIYSSIYKYQKFPTLFIRLGNRFSNFVFTDTASLQAEPVAAQNNFLLLQMIFKTSPSKKKIVTSSSFAVSAKLIILSIINFKPLSVYGSFWSVFVFYLFTYPRQMKLPG